MFNLEKYSEHLPICNNKKIMNFLMQSFFFVFNFTKNSVNVLKKKNNNEYTFD